jgi:hypothetical protein
MQFPTVDELRGIAALTDPAARNLRITHAYFQLSAAAAEKLPGGANWCTFAAWASRQAGQSIRREDLMVALTARLQSDPAIGRILGIAGRGELLAATGAVLGEMEPFRQSSEAVGRGNLKVFDEIAPEFVRFLDAFPEPEDGEAQRPPLLRDAFRNYRRAHHSDSPKSRAEWMLLANLQIGFHEQNRLQPEIEEALNAVAEEPAELGGRIFAKLLPGPLTGVILAQACRLIGGRIRTIARLILTDRLMTLDLPGGPLRLGRDLDAPFPPDLRHIDNEELSALLRLIDPTPDSTRESAALDWAGFAERIHFIADLFRTHHHKQELFSEPA